MAIQDSPRQLISTGRALLLLTIAALTGCHSPRSAVQEIPPVVARFKTPGEAADALVLAAKSEDMAGLARLFGPLLEELKSGDPVADANELKAFNGHVQEGLKIETQANVARLAIGTQGWLFPIPLVQGSDGLWSFDTGAGRQEIVARRVGKNELHVIRFCRIYLEAQRDYASADRDGSGVLQYAQRLVSSPGKKDGLYWPVQADQEQSPLGPLAAEATLEGYQPNSSQFRKAFHGYYFRTLNKQGAAAPGGAYDYVINGHMIAGFGLIASPDKYGVSGIMTFMMNHQGRIYQKDLGPDSLAIARAMREYNPDSSWSLVKE